MPDEDTASPTWIRLCCPRDGRYPLNEWLVINTNKLAGQAGWSVSLSKTGFTTETGRCLSMRMHEAGRVVLLVLLGGQDSGSRALDVINIRRWLAGEAPWTSLPTAKLSAVMHGPHVEVRRKTSHR
jgi:D-alanyl-D-alanine carboxypeptidase